MGWKKRVLIIDDQVFARNSLRRLLEAVGDFEIYEADSGALGLTLFTGLDPKIIFLDIAMPGMTGSDVLKTIRIRNKDVKIVVCSGRPKAEMKQYKDLGANYYLQKPLKYDEFCYVLEHIMK